jgi:hypothetical protein
MIVAHYSRIVLREDTGCCGNGLPIDFQLLSSGEYVGEEIGISLRVILLSRSHLVE